MNRQTLCWSILFAFIAKCDFVEGSPSPSIYPVAFPWFSLTLGLVAYFVLSRRLHWFPYTACMFLIGVILGIVLQVESNNHLRESMKMWTKMDGGLVLVVFLPGLLFLDAYNVNFRLFAESFSQLLLVAFPGVLGGMVLTALVAKSFLGWNFNLAMTFGSIMSATDPVAVCALLNEVGAPPRLKMHVAGESLLNDGAAIVFYTIFQKLFFHDIGLEKDSINLAKGFEIFFKMALGGAAMGIAFGLGLVLVLNRFHRRLESEENITQVTATLTVAYMSFYVSEVVCHLSGVITVVFCAITLRALGTGTINDRKLMQNFWELLEHILNTLLFTLAGILWGSTLNTKSRSEELDGDYISPGSWVGKIFVLYLAIIAIRFVIIFGFYPITSRIGLKSNLKEALFISWGGLRGAVGIALAIALEDLVHSKSESVAVKKNSTEVLFVVGGITFLTLIVNGPTCAPLLRKLRLGNSTASREKIVQVIEGCVRAHIIDDLICLLTVPIFHQINFFIVQEQIPMLEDLTVGEVKHAVIENKKSVPGHKYVRPCLVAILPSLLEKTGSERCCDPEFEEWLEEGRKHREVPLQSTRVTSDRKRLCKSVLSKSVFHNGNTGLRLLEHRLLFIEMLRSGYKLQLDKGHLDPQNGESIIFSLFSSLDNATNDVRADKFLDDWENAESILETWNGYLRKSENFFNLIFYRHLTNVHHWEMRNYVLMIISFVDAHLYAEQKIKEMCDGMSSDFSDLQNTVILESRACVEKAMEKLRTFKRSDVNNIVSYYFSGILLNKAARFVNNMFKDGVLSEKESRHSIEILQKMITRNIKKSKKNETIESSLMREGVRKLSVEREP